MDPSRRIAFDLNFLIRRSLTALALAAICSAASAESFDIVIENGRVIDPETGLDAIRNVGINDDEIVAINAFPMVGDTIIDASGHVVAPGFVDLHANGQNIGDYRMMAVQGVTTALELESGVLPIGAWNDNQTTKNLPINYGASAAWTFGRIAAFIGRVPEATVEYFQDAQLRNDWKSEIATGDLNARIMSLVEQGLQEGGLGIGINAGYAPGHGQKEYFELAELAAKYGVATYTHVRYSSIIEPQGSFEAIKS